MELVQRMEVHALFHYLNCQSCPELCEPIFPLTCPQWQCHCDEKMQDVCNSDCLILTKHRERVGGEAESKMLRKSVVIQYICSTESATVLLAYSHAAC